MLAAPPEERPEKREADFRAALTARAINPKDRWTPECYKAEVQESLLERLSAFFAVQVKYVEPVGKILTAHFMAVAHLQEAEAERALAEMERHLRGMADALPTIATRLAAIEAGLVELVCATMPSSGRYRPQSQFPKVSARFAFFDGDFLNLGRCVHPPGQSKW